VAEPAQHLVHRLAAGLAEDVPQRDIDGGDRAALRPGGGLGQRQRREVAVQRLDAQRVAPQQARRKGLVDVRLDGAGPEVGLAQAADSAIGMDPHPQQVGILAEPQGLDARDLQFLLHPDLRSPTKGLAETMGQRPLGPGGQSPPRSFCESIVLAFPAFCE
jgi:hypothetical protein